LGGTQLKDLSETASGAIRILAPAQVFVKQVVTTIQSPSLILRYRLKRAKTALKCLL
jgi:hypothetical protein